MDLIDMGYFEELAKAAKESIGEYGPFDAFADENEQTAYISIDELAEKAVKKKGDSDVPPWLPPCGDGKYGNCYDCPNFDIEKIPPECRMGYNLENHFVVMPENGGKMKGE